MLIPTITGGIVRDRPRGAVAATDNRRSKATVGVLADNLNLLLVTLDVAEVEGLARGYTRIITKLITAPIV